MRTLAELTTVHAGVGRVDWIAIRPGRHDPMRPVEKAMLDRSGLDGDHARPGKRALTLIQTEHLPVIAALSGNEAVVPDMLRRNIAVSGVNLIALRGKRLIIGGAEVEITVPCAPCSRVEEVLGHGGYNAMRGHGGWCATVIAEGEIAVGDAVVPVDDPALLGETQTRT